jgi:hypothetical protein
LRQRTAFSLEGWMYADPAVSRSARKRFTTSSATDTFLQPRHQDPDASLHPSTVVAWVLHGMRVGGLRCSGEGLQFVIRCRT